MHPPAKRRPFVDEGLRCEIFHREPEKTNGTLENSLPPEELPAALPIYARGRLVEPNAIVIHHAPRGEDDRESVNHKRRVEVLQIARTHDDGCNEEAGKERRGYAGAQAVCGPAQVRWEAEFLLFLSRKKNNRVHAPQGHRRQRQQEKARPDRVETIAEETE